MHGGGEDAIIQRWKEIADADPRWRVEVATTALIYAEPAGCAGAWRKALEGWKVIKSKQVEERRDMAKAEDRAESILTVLEMRVGAIPEELVGSIRSTTDLAALGGWLRFAVKSASLDDFRRDAGL